MHIFPNNKKYIGIAKESRIQKRWGSNGDGYINNRQLAMEYAIKKYGWENIEHIILITGLTKSESKKKEIELIRLYNSFGSGGYNLTPGGDDNSIRCGENNPFAKAVIFNDVKYPTLRNFCDTFGLKPATVSCWLSGYSAMPKDYYDGNLHYEDIGTSVTYVQHGHPKGGDVTSSKRIYFDGVWYDTLSEFCAKYKVNKDSVRNWASGKTSMPQFFYDRNLHYDGEDMSKARRRKRKDKYTYTGPM